MISSNTGGEHPAKTGPERFPGRMNPAGAGYFEIIFDCPHIPAYLD